MASRLVAHDDVGCHAAAANGTPWPSAQKRQLDGHTDRKGDMRSGEPLPSMPCLFRKIKYESLVLRQLSIQCDFFNLSMCVMFHFLLHSPSPPSTVLSDLCASREMHQSVEHDNCQILTSWLDFVKEVSVQITESTPQHACRFLDWNEVPKSPLTHLAHPTHPRVRCGETEKKSQGLVHRLQNALGLEAVSS